MADIPGSVTLTGFIAPTDTADTYATHDDTYGRGGHRAVADLTARNAIPSDRRKEGMMVRVISESATYTLIGGITNSDWSEFTATATDASQTLVAGENVSAYRVVYIDNAGKVWHADKSTISERDRVLGINKTATVINDQTQVAVSGTISNPAWSWTPGPVFVDAAGTMTQTEPGPGFYVVKVGVALSAIKIMIDIVKIGYIEIGIDEVDGGTF